MGLNEAKVEEFINLKQGNMSMREYSLKFTKLSKYTPFMVADLMDRMSKLIFRVSKLVFKECKTTMLVKEMVISHLMTYAKKIEEEKLREHARESKRAQVNSDRFSHQSVYAHGKYQDGEKKMGQGSISAPPPRFNKDMGSIPKTQGGLSAQASPNCVRCRRPLKGE